MKHNYNLGLLKYIWDNRNLDNQAYQYLFCICTEPLQKSGWNRYTIWLNHNGNLVNISAVVHEIVSSQQLKDDIKIWYDKYFYCRPVKVETTGFVSFLLHQFFNGIAHILLKQEIITEIEATEQSYYFIAANNFQRLF